MPANMKYCYMIVWTDKGKGYACFSAQEKMQDWIFGAAFCSPKDRFDKRIARKIAEGRCGSVCINKGNLSEKPRIQDLVLACLNMESIEPLMNLPSWFRKALKGDGAQSHITFTLHNDCFKKMMSKSEARRQLDIMAEGIKK